MEATFRMFRGTHQIGGCSAEFKVGDNRIIIDFGANLPGTDNILIDDKTLVNTVFKPENKEYDKEHTKAVLFTHYHGDHIGLKNYIPKGIKKYIGPLALDIMKSVASRTDKIKKDETLKDMPSLNEMEEYRNCEPINLNMDGITVTPVRFDHSAIDSYMFFIEINNKKILYTGDFREHGYSGKESFEKLNNLIKEKGEVDILITEGTMISRISEISNDLVPDEKELMKKASIEFENHKENFVIVSSTNIDSIISFYRAVPKDKAFLCDYYQAEIIKKVMDSCPDFKYGKQIYVLCEEEKWEKIKYKLGERYFGHAKKEIYSGKTTDKIKGYVMLMRPGNEYLNERFKEAENPFIIYSMWSGYLKGQKCENPKLVRFLNGYEDDEHFRKLHTSGHAYAETIEKLIEITNPKTIIPMHTEYNDKFAESEPLTKYKNRVYKLKDNDILEIK